MHPKINFSPLPVLLQALAILVIVSGCAAQSWTHCFAAGNKDANGRVMGGSEVLHLVGHQGCLYAAVGYWQDEGNLWYGGSNFRSGWAQILRLEEPSGKWQVDHELGAFHLRPEILKEVRFTTDGEGKLLDEPATLLVACAYSRSLTGVVVHAFTRISDASGWVKTRICKGPLPGGERYSVRDLHVHRDAETGVDRVFVTVGTVGIFSGVYDPKMPGRIDWDTKPEGGPFKIRPLGMAAANGSLHVSSGSQILRRVDGLDPNYVVVHDLKDESAYIKSAVGGVRGLTAVANPNGEGDALLFMWSPNGQSQGEIYRLEPRDEGGYTRHKEAVMADLMSKHLGASRMAYVLGAYNEMLAYSDSSTGLVRHLVGLEGRPQKGSFATWKGGYYRGALFAVRDELGGYRIEEVGGSISPSDPALVATRCYALSPFVGERAIYFGGHDPNGFVSTDMAWIYKRTLPKQGR